MRNTTTAQSVMLIAPVDFVSAHPGERIAQAKEEIMGNKQMTTYENRESGTKTKRGTRRWRRWKKELNGTLKGMKCVLDAGAGVSSWSLRRCQGE